MAANTDKFRKIARRWTGAVGSAGINDAVTQTLPLASAANLPTDTAIDLTFQRVDANGTRTPSVEESVTTVISGNNATVAIRGIEGTAQSHAAGTVVENLWNAKTHNDMVDGILVEHNQDGTHASSIVKTTTGATDLPLTTPKVTTSIKDANGNEIIVTPATASAVNEFTLTNAATGNSPSLSMSGGDSNIGLDIKMKGTGKLRKPTVVGIQVLDSGTDTATGDGKAFFRVPAELNGMNLTGVAACVYTAGTTNTTDIQIRNVTDSVDMLSTKITIDSTETDSSTAATAAVIDTTKDDVATGDKLAIDIDAVSTTAAKGLYVELRFELPA